MTPRLEQEIRTDFVHQYNTKGFSVWNYGNGKGLELIPEKHTEIIVNVPPFYNRSNGESDGFGDISFLGKYRFYARNEEKGNACGGYADARGGEGLRASRSDFDGRWLSAGDQRLRPGSLHHLE